MTSHPCATGLHALCWAKAGCQVMAPCMWLQPPPQPAAPTVAAHQAAPCIPEHLHWERVRHQPWEVGSPARTGRTHWELVVTWLVQPPGSGGAGVAVSCRECCLAEWDPWGKEHTAPAQCSSPQLTLAAPAWFQCLLPQLLLSELMLPLPYPAPLSASFTYLQAEGHDCPSPAHGMSGT